VSITADWQGELAGTFTFGQGTSYRWRADGFSGVGLAAYRMYDLARGPQIPGVVASFDTLEGRLVALPLVVTAATAAATQVAFQALKAAWKPRTADTTLDLRMPGMAETTLRLYGRPRAVSGEQWTPRGNVVTCVAEFLATDPFFYGAEVTVVSNSGSTITLSNAGDADSRRATLTVTPQTAAPTLANTGDSGSVTFATTLTSGTAATVALLDQSITYSGAARADLVDPSSPWFMLAPGSNVVTFTGASAVSCVFRPAYH
jgi:hypothetical protein